MNNNQILDVLSSFSPREARKFYEFLNSPYFNKSAQIRCLYNALQDLKAGNKFDSAEKEMIFRKVFGKKNYNDVLLRNLFSDLLALTERFLGQLYFDRNDWFQRSLYTLREFRQRKLPKQFVKELRNIESHLSGNKGVDEIFFRKFADMLGEKITYYVFQNKTEVIVNDVAAEGINLICYFIICMAQKVHDLHVLKYTLNFKPEHNTIIDFFDNLNLDKLIENLKDAKFEYYPVLEIFYYQVMSLRHLENEEYFSKFREKFYRHMNMFTKDWQHHLFLFLESCCIEKKRAGVANVDRGQHIIYRNMLETENYVPSSEKFMALDRFRSIVINALVLNEYEWTADFIEKYNSKVHPEQRDNMYNYAMGLLNFTSKSYESALVYTGKVKYEYFVFRVDVKLLLLMLYYELNHFESIYSLIDSFKHFLSKNKFISKQRKDLNFTFLNFIKELVQYKNGEKRSEIGFLKNKIKKKQMVFYKSWLIEKAEELENKPGF